VELALNAIGRKLRELRGSRTLREVAKAAGISETYLKNIKSGQRQPTGEHLYLRILCLGLGLPKRKACAILHNARLQELGIKDRRLREICVADLQGELTEQVRQALAAT
jgi:transcriptional regulator with XRE-family HTH domain